MLLTEQKVSFLTLLQKNKKFRRIWLAQVVSELGDWFNLVALFQLLQRYTPQEQVAKATALLLIVQAIPAILWSPLAGMVADRFSRKKVMVIADVLRALVVLGYFFIQGKETVWLLYVLATTHFSISAFFEPARSALIPTLTQPQELEVANTLSAATWSFMLAIGSALGGLLCSVLPLSFAFLIDACSFITSALLIGSMALSKSDFFQYQKSDTFLEQPQTKIETLPEGQNHLSVIKFLKKKPQLVSILFIKLCLALTGGAAWYLATIYGQHVFPLGKEGSLSLGLLYAGSGVGAIAGTYLLHRFSSTNKRALFLSYLARIPVFILFAFSSHLALATIAMLIQSISGSFLWVASTTLLQKNAPNSLQGRLFSIEMAGHTLGFALSNLIPAYLLSHLLTKPGFVWQTATSSISLGVAGVATFITLLWAFLLYRSSLWKQVEE